MPLHFVGETIDKRAALTSEAPFSERVVATNETILNPFGRVCPQRCSGQAERATLARRLFYSPPSTLKI